MALKDILNNAKYGDDMVLSLPDGTTATVGEFRSLEAEEKAALASRNSTLTQAEMEFATRVREAVDNGLFTPPAGNRGDDHLRRAAQTEFGLDESDPLLGQVVKEMKRLSDESNKKIEAMQTEHKAELKKIVDITAKATGAYLNDRYQSRFQSTVSNLPPEIAKKVSLEDAVKYCETHRLMDSVGAYDIPAAIDRLTWNDLKEHERKVAKEQAQKDAQTAADLARVTPGSRRPNAITTQDKDAFSPVVKDGDRTRTKSLDEVLAEAAQDSQLWAQAALGPIN